jgi:hypothetical protein
LGHFAGKGYDARFTRNMARIHTILQAKPETPVLLRHGEDDLCACCPHRGTACDNAREYDRRVLRSAGLRVDETHPWQALQTAVARVSVRAVCGGCPWILICKKGEKSND